MRITHSLRQIANNQTLDALKRSISKTISEAAPRIQAAKENQVKILSQKFTEFNDWYMKITGLDKVNLAQEKVTALQDQLLQIQEQRRTVGRQLSDVRQRSMELQDEIHKVKRQEDLERFLELMKKETEVLRLEKSITKTFQDYDQTERELFTAFSDSIRDSHEKQRAQMEYTKYFGIVLSIAGSFLAFIYSTLRKEQLKQIIDDRLQMLNHPGEGEVIFSQLMESNKKIMEEVLNNQKSFSQFSSALVKKISEIENKNNTGNVSPILTTTVVEEVTNESDNRKSFLNEKINYVQVFGVILGLWLISRALTG